MTDKVSFDSPYGRYDKKPYRHVNSLSSKSEPKAKRDVPEWQKRLLTSKSDKNTYEELSLSTNEDISDITMHLNYPRTNTPLDFYPVYDTSGEIKKARRITSGHGRSVTPSRTGSALSVRGDLDLSLKGRQETYYNEVKKVYDVDKGRKMRQKEFFQRYTSFRSNYDNETLREQRQAERLRIDRENQILKDLKRKRTEFQREKEWRVRCQYVTWKQLEHERMDRESHGLPLNVQADFYLKKRKPMKTMSIKHVVRNETPRYQTASKRHIREMFGTTYPTIDPKLKPPAFGRNNNNTGIQRGTDSFEQPRY